MVFSSLSFLVFFLPAVLGVYYLTPRRCRRARNLILLIASLLFYGWSGLKNLPLLILSAAANTACGARATGT